MRLNRCAANVGSARIWFVVIRRSQRGRGTGMNICKFQRYFRLMRLLEIKLMLGKFHTALQLCRFRSVTVSEPTKRLNGSTVITRPHA
jgi:hypothetical protein